jgi:hypothetical protein
MFDAWLGYWLGTLHDTFRTQSLSCPPWRSLKVFRAFYKHCQEIGRSNQSGPLVGPNWLVGWIVQEKWDPTPTMDCLCVMWFRLHGNPSAPVCGSDHRCGLWEDGPCHTTELSVLQTLVASGPTSPCASCLTYFTTDDVPNP